MSIVAESTQSIPGIPVDYDTIGLPAKVEPQTVQSTQTVTANFASIVHLLSARPIRRPARRISNEMLRRIASRANPDPDYFDRDEKKPF